MERTPVKSSMFKSVGYDPATRILELEFSAGGGIYQYHDVSPGDWKQFATTESHGKHFGQNIRGKFKCLKIEHEGLVENLEEKLQESVDRTKPPSL